jgi:hypothetical protein
MIVSIFKKKKILLKIKFFYILYCFNKLISKIILKNKKIILIYFNTKNILKNNNNWNL